MTGTITLFSSVQLELAMNPYTVFGIAYFKGITFVHRLLFSSKQVDYRIIHYVI